MNKMIALKKNENEELGNEDNPDLEEENSKDDEFDFEDYLDEDEIPSYKLAANNSSADQDKKKKSPFLPGLPFRSSCYRSLV